MNRLQRESLFRIEQKCQNRPDAHSNQKESDGGIHVVFNFRCSFHKSPQVTLAGFAFAKEITADLVLADRLAARLPVSCRRALSLWLPALGLDD